MNEEQLRELFNTDPQAYDRVVAKHNRLLHTRLKAKLRRKLRAQLQEYRDKVKSYDAPLEVMAEHPTPRVLRLVERFRAI